jgi:DNA/RNA-binding domain of Phe-tRNA-synthetase-like protein
MKKIILVFMINLLIVNLYAVDECVSFQCGAKQISKFEACDYYQAFPELQKQFAYSELSVKAFSKAFSTCESEKQKQRALIRELRREIKRLNKLN